MNLFRARPFAIGIAMCVAAGLAIAVTPTARVAARQPALALEEAVPSGFGDWALENANNMVVVNPQAEETLSRIYQQTLSRTYRNRRTGERVMLSIAYGGDQSDDLRVHRPEICYHAQGFQVSDARTGVIETRFGVLPVKRLVAQSGPRNEPITYWVTMGDRAVVAGSLKEKLTQLRYGLTGKVPDGMLVRVSSIGRNLASQHELQNRFIVEMLVHLDGAVRSRLIGRAQT